MRFGEELGYKYGAINRLGEIMKINGNEIRVGNVLEHNGKLWAVAKTEHVKPGKGGAFAQVEMKCLQDNTKLNERFRASETVERVRLEEREHQFLYPEGSGYTFMDQETFEQVSIDGSMIGDVAVYLTEGMIVKVCSYEGQVISVSLPDTIIATIVEADPSIKGQTATASFKPAILDNGVRIMVPPHVESGTRVVVNTVDSTYVERAKE